MLLKPEVPNHEYAEFINELRDTANKHAGCQSMREALGKVVRKHLVYTTGQHKIALQHHARYGGWTNICVKCGKTFPLPEGFYPPIEKECHEDVDSILWVGQPAKYDPALDCELVR